MGSRIVSGFVFDVDATLVDTAGAIDKIWMSWAQKHGLSFERIVPHMHGRRIVETLTRVDPQFATFIHEQEVTDIAVATMKQATAIVGAVEFTNQLPIDRWAIATSGAREIAMTSLSAAGISLPHIMICAEDVSHGKPHPEPFALAVKGLNLQADQCAAFEDSPAGIASAKAAGCFTIALLTSHREDELREADLIIHRYADLRVSHHADGFELSW